MSHRIITLFFVLVMVISLHLFDQYVYPLHGFTSMYSTMIGYNGKSTLTSRKKFCKLKTIAVECFSFINICEW